MITAFYTCRRPVPYIGQTLDNYFDLYVEKPLVFEQQGTEGYLNRSRVIVVPTTGTCLISNWLFMVEWLAANTQDTHYMLCEDDIVIRDRVIVPNVSTDYYSPYCSEVNKNGNGWHEPLLVHHGFCGALCIILPRMSLEWIVQCKEQFLQLTNGLHLDAAIGKFFNKGLVHYPTLVLHIGDISTREVNNNKDHPLSDKLERCRLPAL